MFGYKYRIGTYKSFLLNKTFNKRYILLWLILLLVFICLIISSIYLIFHWWCVQEINIADKFIVSEANLLLSKRISTTNTNHLTPLQQLIVDTTFATISNKNKEFRLETKLLEQTSFSLLEISYKSSQHRIQKNKIPRISIIIPCYNSGKHVLEAVNSVLNQNYPKDYITIIVVNDHSSDKFTLEALNELHSILYTQYGNIIIINNPINRHLSASRNIGILRTSELDDYILFLDNDDLLDEPSSLLLLSLSLTIFTDVSYIYPEQWFFGEEKLVWSPQEYNLYDLLWSNHPTVCSLIRRRSIIEAGKYNENMLMGAEDWFMWLALGNASYYGKVLNLPLFKYRKYGKTMSDNTINNMDKIREYIINYYKDSLYLPSMITTIKQIHRPFISVIIPFCNPDLAYFTEAIYSLNNQTTSDFELILIDDASTNKEIRVFLDEIINKSNRFRHLKITATVVNIDKNNGVSAARNRGAILAKGDYLIFLDADDKLTHTALESLSLFMLSLRSSQSGLDIAFVYSSIHHFGDIESIESPVFDIERLKLENFLVVTVLIDRDKFIQFGGFDEKYDLFEDWDLWLKLVSNGFRGQLYKEPLFEYRRHNNGRTKENNNKYTNAEMITSLRYRNPSIYNDSIKTIQPQYASLNKEIANLRSENDLLILHQYNLIIKGFSRYYSSYLSKVLPIKSNRRPNFLNFFSSDHWNNHQNIIRILYLIPLIGLGGSEVVDLQILSGLKDCELDENKNNCGKKRFWITLLVESTEIQDEWKERFKEVANEIFYLAHLTNNFEDHFMYIPPSTNLLQDIMNYFLISRNIDIVFNRNTYIGYNMFESWSDFNHNYNQSVRFIDLIHLYEPINGAWERYSYLYDKLIHERVLVSEDLKNFIFKTYPSILRNNINVIYCGVDVSKFNPDTVTPGKLLRQLSNIANKIITNTSYYLIAYIGRFTAQKEPFIWLNSAINIIKYWPISSKQQPIFVLIGAGSLENEILNFINHNAVLSLNNNIIVLQQYSKIEDYLIDISVLLITSSFEGLPLILLESMSMGIPIVSTSVGAIPEIQLNMKRRKSIGIYLVPFIENINLLTKQLALYVIKSLNVNSTKRRQMSVSLRQQVIQNFNLRSMQQNYINLFMKMYNEIDGAKFNRLLLYQSKLMEGVIVNFNNFFENSFINSAPEIIQEPEPKNKQNPLIINKVDGIHFINGMKLIGYNLVVYKSHNPLRAGLFVLDTDPTAVAFPQNNKINIIDTKEVLKLNLIWKAPNLIGKLKELNKHNYLSFLHIRNFHNEVIMSFDQYINNDEYNYPTIQWSKVGELINDCRFIKEFPSNIKSGIYRIVTGLSYSDSTSGEWINTEIIYGIQPTITLLLIYIDNSLLLEPYSSIFSLSTGFWPQLPLYLQGYFCPIEFPIFAQQTTTTIVLHLIFHCPIYNDKDKSHYNQSLSLLIHFRSITEPSIILYSTESSLNSYNLMVNSLSECYTKRKQTISSEYLLDIPVREIKEGIIYVLEIGILFRNQFVKVENLSKKQANPASMLPLQYVSLQDGQIKQIEY